MSEREGAASIDVEERASRLAPQLAALTGIDVTVLPDGLATSLRSLDIDSLVFIDFLVRTEETFGFEWDEETPPEAFETLLTMASTMLDVPVGAAAGGQAP